MESSTFAEMPDARTMDAATKTFLLSRTVRDLLRSAPVLEAYGARVINVVGFLTAALDRGELTTAATALQNAFDARALEVLRPIGGAAQRGRNSASTELSSGLWEALSKATEIRQQTGGNDQFVGLRYVLLVMVTAESGALAAEIGAVFSLTGSNRNEAARAVAEYCIRHREPPEKRDAWAYILNSFGLGAALEEWPEGDLPESAAAATKMMDAFQSIALLHPDNPWAEEIEDESGAVLEARAFADMIVAEKFQPPLAVGVFGDWGSGKSYFLRLLHQEVADNRRRQARDAGTGFTFCQRVVQIRFNAWHYAETNLWASLVDHIFTSLNQWTIATGSAKEADRLFEQLTTAQRLTIEAAAVLAASRRARAEAATRLAEAESKLRQQKEIAEENPATFVRSAFNTVTAQEDVKQQLSDAGKTLGLDAISENSNALVSATQSLDNELSRFALLRNGTVRALASPCTILLVAAGTLVLPPIASRVAAYMAGDGAQLGASIGGFIAPVVAALGWATAKTKAAVDVVSKYRTQFEAEIARQTENDNAAKEARARELAAAEARVADAAETLRQTTANAAEAALAYNSENGSERMLRFIRNKVANGEYAKHLSFIATARKDFEELSRLMTEAATPALDAERARVAHQKRVDELLAKDGALLDEEEQEKLRATAAAPTEQGDKVFERIVLYMDDLDRCAPEQVIAVLQAIHLLLAFPLFVVFVAVDVRWLRQALATCYPGQISDTDDINASTSDYLEKIFQIAYWVRPFDADCTRKVLEARIGMAPGKTTADTGAGSAQPGGADPGGPADPGLGGSQPDPDEPAWSGPVPPQMQPMSMTDAERTCLVGMASALDGLPRRTLRFLNSYWIIKGGLERGEQGQLEDGGYAALAALLAISITMEDGFPGLVSQIRTLSATGQKNAGLTKNLTVSDEAVTARIQACLAAAGNPGMQDLQRYAALVSRYSFHRGL